MEEFEAIRRQANQPCEHDKGQSNKGNGNENLPPKLRFQNHTPLNTSLYKILDDVKALELLHPFKRKKPIVRLWNAKKYYKHNTIEYVMLKYEIEDLICKGHLC